MRRHLRREDSKLLAVVRQMPAREHWPNRNEPFDVLRSEVIHWLARQPDVMDWLFMHLRSRHLIVFDRETNLWQGVDR